METFHIKDRPRQITQKKIAEFIGITQGAVSQMQSSGRECYLTVDENFAITEFAETNRVSSPKSRSSYENL